MKKVFKRLIGSVILIALLVAGSVQYKVFMVELTIIIANLYITLIYIVNFYDERFFFYSFFFFYLKSPLTSP
ncbi:hypothetical protein CD32_12355 [Lysinibacillus odysseyi 34hs-1 = NBRC 100172]|uniref:Uncharacterized protein n=1 Tax=Lysinibacillus odysseyi 34hs-1 = NBRC 100172 TaxID=1220589 RepID=A0A0A3INH9_9BACI|nr:hypothetical protein CD32_12355 [Lysinibacillus odysseyi 34hs-1 = NBRC 100172]